MIKEKSKEIKFVTVLDFEDGRVYQYAIKDIIEDHYSIEEYDVELFLEDKLHNLRNCEYMLHEKPEIIT